MYVFDLAMWNKALAQRISNREFKFWMFHPGIESIYLPIYRFVSCLSACLFIYIYVCLLYREDDELKK